MTDANEFLYWVCVLGATTCIGILAWCLAMMSLRGDR